uniref:glycogen debranching protein GlgX n=1 Tax=Mariniflexile sp. TaxID=1979402 RepID=UPI00404848D0
MNPKNHKKEKTQTSKDNVAYKTSTGKSSPLGATVYPNGVNFSVFSKNSERVELWFFLNADDTTPFQVIPLDAEKNKSFYYWHVFVKDLKPDVLYGYKVFGEYDPSKGNRFDGEKLLLDPYARAVVKGENYSRAAAVAPGDNAPYAMKGVVIDPYTYDWEGDEPLYHPYAQSIVYELHVKGFTKHPNSGIEEDMRGTYTGLIEKIPYLNDLGITAVELMPVYQFDETDAPSPQLQNYWGYSPLAFFAPHGSYCYCDEPQVNADEFRDMVKAFHKAGIEVILDVVFNHTGEGNQTGPVISFKGLENSFYYILADNPEYFADFSGCGNTLNTNQYIVRRLIIDALKRWVTEMHVDGFRFDLASVMSRDEHGNPMDNPPILWEIESHPVLSRTKIIAEAWDTGGLYQVGSFIGNKWAEWNGKYRDDTRRFLRGDNGMVHAFAASIAGSLELYNKPFRDPNRSINFITCHDGFTLNDLVSYNTKHNQANGEENRDGSDENHSSNYGAEGPTDNLGIETIRLRQIKNFFVVLLLSQGTPMISMGDEVRRTQLGNNNAYCQDNEISWFDWDKVHENRQLLEFVKHLVRFRKDHPIFQLEKYWAIPDPGEPNILWHGTKLNQPDWSYYSHSIAYTLQDKESDCLFHFMINAYWEPLPFELPENRAGKNWYRIVDTHLSHPDDFKRNELPLEHAGFYELKPQSIVVLKEGDASSKA